MFRLPSCFWHSQNTSNQAFAFQAGGRVCKRNPAGSRGRTFKNRHEVFPNTWHNWVTLQKSSQLTSTTYRDFSPITPKHEWVTENCQEAQEGLQHEGQRPRDTRGMGEQIKGDRLSKEDNIKNNLKILRDIKKKFTSLKQEQDTIKGVWSIQRTRKSPRELKTCEQK